MAKRKQLSWHAEQVKAYLLANDPTTCAQWGEYELSGSLADRMEEIVYNHGYEAARMIDAGDAVRAKSTKARIEKEFWELAKYEGLVGLLEKAWEDGLEAGGSGVQNPQASPDVAAAYELARESATFDDFKEHLVHLLDRRDSLATSVLRGMNEPGYAQWLGTDEPILLYHGSPVMDLDEQGLRLTRGRRAHAFLGAEYEVDNLALFLTDSKLLAEFYAQSRADSYQYRVYEVYANLGHVLDMTNVRKLPTRLKRLAADLAQAYRGGTRTLHQHEAWWVLDQKPFVAEVTRLGYTAAVLFEDIETIRELRKHAGKNSVSGRPRTYAVFSPSAVVVRSAKHDIVRTPADLRQWYEQVRRAA